MASTHRKNIDPVIVLGNIADIRREWDWEIIDTSSEESFWFSEDERVVYCPVCEGMRACDKCYGGVVTSKEASDLQWQLDAQSEEVLCPACNGSPYDYEGWYVGCDYCDGLGFVSMANADRIRERLDDLEVSTFDSLYASASREDGFLMECPRGHAWIEPFTRDVLPGADTYLPVSSDECKTCLERRAEKERLDALHDLDDRLDDVEYYLDRLDDSDH